MLWHRPRSQVAISQRWIRLVHSAHQGVRVGVDGQYGVTLMHFAEHAIGPSVPQTR